MPYQLGTGEPQGRGIKTGSRCRICASGTTKRVREPLARGGEGKNETEWKGFIDGDEDLV